MPLTPHQISQMKTKVKDQNEKLQEIFSALSDPTRCRIFRLLLVANNNEVNVSDIAHVMDSSLPAVSQQLKILEQAGLVTKHRKGQMMFYEIEHDDTIMKLLIKILSH